jgi:uncharacterized alkaline shock family protein YloU
MTDFSPENLAASSGSTPFAPPRDETPIKPPDPAPDKTPDRTPEPARTPTGFDPSNGAQRLVEVKGRIKVADEVVEKVAALAAYEVEGVADLGGDVARTLENVRERIGIGQKRGDQGVKARVTGRDVSIDVTIVILYGHVVMDIARQVKHNVAHQANRMLGLNVVEVNVTVDDVDLPQARQDEYYGDGVISGES